MQQFLCQKSNYFLLLHKFLSQGTSQNKDWVKVISNWYFLIMSPLILHYIELNMPASPAVSQKLHGMLFHSSCALVTRRVSDSYSNKALTPLSQLKTTGPKEHPENYNKEIVQGPQSLCFVQLQ